MKKSNITPVISLLLIFSFLVFCFTAGAQSLPAKTADSLRAPANAKNDTNKFPKEISLFDVTIKAKRAKLPETQQISLRAPDKVKIDGKPNEWNNQFQAYNHATDIFYTIANDDDNLYLVIQANNQGIVNRIVGGGIMFTVQKSLQQKDKNGASITYPTYTTSDEKSSLSFNLPGLRKGGQDTSLKETKLGQFYRNQVLGQKCKWIRVSGIAGFDDLISAFNTDSLRATAAFDIRGVYTFELFVALKHLGLSTNDQTKFAYHIQVNGAKDTHYNPGASSAPATIFDIPGRDFMKPPDLPVMRPIPMGSVQSLPTDFWAEYTLAKK
jgi:hypothetical protein